MRTCAQSLTDFGLRALGRDWGAMLLPKGADITLCDQVVLIGSGMIWNLYFAAVALAGGFGLAVGLALARLHGGAVLRRAAAGFIFVFRGSPLFIQFFLAYEALMLLPRAGIEIDLIVVTLTAETRWLTRAWAGGLIVLMLNTSAYTAEIFYGALRAMPKGDLEAADAFGLTGWHRFRRIVWPTMLRLAWPSYTNEAIFLFHATTLVFLSSFPALQQSGEALYYARYFAQQTFNPFVAFPIVAGYFILATLGIILVFGAINRRLNRHLPQERRRPLRLRPQYLR